jgi:hypothetical protein
VAQPPELAHGAAIFGFILYILLVHLVLDALPRYLFPAMLCWWAFAGMTLSRLRRPGTAARW